MATVTGSGPRMLEVNTLLKRLFVDHPNSVGETYFEHQRRALGFAGAMFLGSVACFVHSLVPGAFTSTASRTISRLHDLITARSR